MLTEREILDNLIQDGKDAEDKLKKLDEPVFNHGDYGEDTKGRPTLVCKNGGRRNQMHAGGSTGYLETMTIKQLNDRKPELIYGNIFKDMNHNSLDLTRWISNYSKGNRRFIIEIGPDDTKVFLGAFGAADSYSLNDVIEIHRTIGQAIATIKRKEQNET